MAGTKKQQMLLLLSCAAWCCLAAAGDTLAERAIDGAIGSQYVYTANIPAPRIVSGARKGVKTASITGRELSDGVVGPDVTAAATAEELAAIEAAIARLELAAQGDEPVTPSLRQRARAATLADSMPLQQKKRSAAAVSIASVQPEQTEEASEAAAAAAKSSSAPTDVNALVAGLQATLASLESAGQDLSSPEVQAVLAEAGSVIEELEAQSKEQQVAAAVDAKEQQQQQHADSQQKAHPHAVLPDSEWVKVQADPEKDTETAAALAAAENPEEVQSVLAELEAAIAAAEAAAAAGLQA